MGGKKPSFDLVSYGLYEHWDRGTKDLPRIKQFTTTIEAVADNEFGMVINIKGGRGKWLEYCIKHPPIPDEHGNLLPDFTGEYRIETNDYHFFIGDCIWEPVDNKVGQWVVQVFYEGKMLFEKVFDVVPS